MRQTELHLADEDRELIETCRTTGLHHAREVNRAHILSALDRGIPEAQIMEVLGVGRTAIWRTRSAYLEGGAEYALGDVARTGKPRLYATDVEAKITVLACSEPPVGAKRWTLELLEQAAQRQADIGPISRETIRRLLKKLPQTMAQGDVVHRRADRGIPGSECTICSIFMPVRTMRKNLLSVWTRRANNCSRIRGPLCQSIQPGSPAKQDYEYIRAGTCNLFVAVEPKGGRRTVVITEHRAKTDLWLSCSTLLAQVYVTARRIHLVMDNLNIHFRKCFEEVLGAKEAKALLRRVVFHYTPKHASWLNMAEIEIGILDRQCLDRRLPDRATLTAEVDAWQLCRNREKRSIEWTFTQDADTKLARHYVS